MKLVKNVFHTWIKLEEVMSDEFCKSVIKETSKNIHDKIKEAERKAEEKLEADRKAESELEETARIEKKIKDLKIATSCAIEVFSSSRVIGKSFESFVEVCKHRIQTQTSRTKSASIELNDDEFQMILDSLVEDGYIIRQELNSSILKKRVTYKYNSEK